MATTTFSERTPYYAEGLALPFTPASGYAPVEGDLVSISGDRTLSKSGADAQAVGVVRYANAGLGEYTVEIFRRRYLIKVVAAANLTAGGSVKTAAASSGVQRVAAFVAGTDVEALRLGLVWVGGASGATVEILV